MLTEDTIKQVLCALVDANLVVCEYNIIGPDHPALCLSLEYIIGRVEESGGLSGRHWRIPKPGQLSDDLSETKCPNCGRIQHAFGPCGLCGCETEVL